MLLRHAWLAPLVLPSTITEEDEELPEESLTDEATALNPVNKEVSQWVLDAMERKKNGAMGKKAKPALHAVSLDAVPSQSPDTTSA